MNKLVENAFKTTFNIKYIKVYQDDDNHNGGFTITGFRMTFLIRYPKQTYSVGLYYQYFAPDDLIIICGKSISTDNPLFIDLCRHIMYNIGEKVYYWDDYAGLDLLLNIYQKPTIYTPLCKTMFNKLQKHFDAIIDKFLIFKELGYVPTESDT